MSDDIEPEQPASEQPKSTCERKSRKRSAQPKTSDKTKRCLVQRVILVRVERGEVAIEA